MDIKWVFWKSHTVYDFDESRAVIMRTMLDSDGFYQEDVDEYLSELVERFGNGYCWVDEIDVNY